MPEDVSSLDPLSSLKAHLESPSLLVGREADFDMNDVEELKRMSAFPEIEAALHWLGDNVSRPWQIADREALRTQKWHRFLAGVAIGSGTAAIILAVLQLSIRLKFPSLSDAAVAVEVFAVVAAFIAVVFGLVAKFDRKWLEHRCRAERLRMLKFRSLCRLGWCKDEQEWQAWVKGQLKLESDLDFSKIKQWSKGDAGSAESLVWNNRTRDFAKALTAYYRIKRLNFQADYFNSRRQKYEKLIAPWRRRSLAIFFGSVCLVIVHVLVEKVFTPWLESRGHHRLAEAGDIAAVGCVTHSPKFPQFWLGGGARFAAF
jgi:hypothetical protein